MEPVNRDEQSTSANGSAIENETNAVQESSGMVIDSHEHENAVQNPPNVSMTVDEHDQEDVVLGLADISDRWSDAVEAENTVENRSNIMTDNVSDVSTHSNDLVIDETRGIAQNILDAISAAESRLQADLDRKLRAHECKTQVSLVHISDLVSKSLDRIYAKLGTLQNAVTESTALTKAVQAAASTQTIGSSASSTQTSSEVPDPCRRCPNAQHSNADCRKKQCPSCRRRNVDSRHIEWCAANKRTESADDTRPYLQSRARYQAATSSRDPRTPPGLVPMMSQSTSSQTNNRVMYVRLEGHSLVLCHRDDPGSIPVLSHNLPNQSDDASN